jgi:1,2-dihydroxy-3-keto-5-methylthiopentene dioxygenase
VTLLQIMTDDGAEMLVRTSDIARITAELDAEQIGFARWAADRDLSARARPDEVLAAYRSEVARLRAQGGYRLVDVVRLAPDPADPQWPATAKAARAKFLEEHTHDEDEVRFFVTGRGCFYLHLGTKVCAVVCEAGDLLSVPAGTPHWFDMGEQPDFCAIRFFQEDDGWVGNFTGSLVAHRIPTLDELLAAVG